MGMNKTPTSSQNTTVYISNLSYERDRNGLKGLFSKFGVIKHIKIIVEPTSNQSRGMAFVEMATVKEAQSAIDSLNQQVIDGRTVKASWAVPQKEVTKFYPAVTNKDKDLKKKNVEKDLEFTSTQLAKKARNEAKRKSNPLVFKAKTKTKTK
jgi:RNA recognition motif-containing protein